MSGNFEKTDGRQLSVDEIMAKIREEVERRKCAAGRKAQHAEGTASGLRPGEEPAREEQTASSFFWKYGLKHAKFIKQIPFIRNIAEKCYCYMANRRTSPGTTTMSQVIEVRHNLNIDMNYSGFLAQLKHEGLKGKIKLFIFKIIGFFAWWQEQINAALYQKIAGLHDEILDKDRQIGELRDRLSILDRAEEALHQEIVSHNVRIQDMKQQLRMHELSVIEQQRSLADFREDMRKRESGPVSWKQLEEMAEEDNHTLDALYVAFEDRFRGTREDIKDRQRVYLPYIERAGAGTEAAPVIDVGSGRGEWLELLKENSCTAKGVDTNRVMIELCRERGFDVVESDALHFLRGQASNLFGAITGFHIIEHLPPRILVALFDESLRTLKPGGIIIFETPNPENLIVGACNFYFDPTHRKPLPPDQIQFIAEQRGFVGIQIIRLHKVKEPEYTGQEPIDEVIRRLNMEQDYSIIGYKA